MKRRALGQSVTLAKANRRREELEAMNRRAQAEWNAWRDVVRKKAEAFFKLEDTTTTDERAVIRAFEHLLSLGLSCAALVEEITELDEKVPRLASVIPLLFPRGGR